VVTIVESTTVREACVIMRDRRVAAMPIMRDGLLCGIFTERDATFRVLAEGRDPDRTPVGTVMTADPITLPPDARAADALTLMRERGIRHLPILDGTELVAILSMRDLHEAVLTALQDDTSFLDLPDL